MLNKTLILLIKYIPIIQMICVIVFNTMTYHNMLLEYCRLSNIITGNSVIATILLLFCSVIFKYGVWHRLIVVSNFIIILIILIDRIFRIPISNLELLVLYYVVYSIFLLLILIVNLKQKRIAKKHRNADSVSV